MSKRPLVYWNILGEGARKASKCKIKKSADIFLREEDISKDYHGHENSCHQSFILEQQSGAEIESMIEHLEMREYFDLSFLGRIGALAKNLNRSFDEECRYVGL